MIPFLHIGPLSIPTYGLMVALGMICAAYIFQADFDRRGVKADAFTMITIAGLAGIFGSKLYSALESPTEFLAIRSRNSSSLWLHLVWGIPRRFFCNAHSRQAGQNSSAGVSGRLHAAASFGYAIGRMGCLLSGDGDYGTPTTLPWA